MADYGFFPVKTCIYSKSFLRIIKLCRMWILENLKQAIYKTIKSMQEKIAFMYVGIIRKLALLFMSESVSLQATMKKESFESSLTSYCDYNS